MSRKAVEVRGARATPTHYAPYRQVDNIAGLLHSPYSFRLPKSGTVDPYFGCSRSWWNERILPCPANNFKPPIKSFTDAAQGHLKGVRFVLFSSALQYFEGLASKDSGRKAAGAAPSETDSEDIGGDHKSESEETV